MDGVTVPEARILIVDDEPSIVELLSVSLKFQGFEVETASNGAEGLDRARTFRPDAVILDVMMPGMDGFGMLRRLRADGSDAPVLFLTAKDTVEDKVSGLTLGADDYVTKPFSGRELLARIRAVLRRGQDIELVSDVVEAGGVRMDTDRHELSVRGEPVQLALKEFELLELLLRNSGRVLTRGQLIDRVWGPDYVGDTKTLDVHVKRLRAKIEVDPANPILLVTVRGLGYKFNA